MKKFRFQYSIEGLKSLTPFYVSVEDETEEKARIRAKELVIASIPWRFRNKEVTIH